MFQCTFFGNRCILSNREECSVTTHVKKTNNIDVQYIHITRKFSADRDVMLVGQQHHCESESYTVSESLFLSLIT